MNRLRKFILNGMLLTVVSLFMRTVSVSYNVYISNRLGAEVMGLFTLISTVYGFAITVATSGINLGTTRLVAEAMGKRSAEDSSFFQKKTPLLQDIMKKCFGYSLCFGLASATVLYFFAPSIGNVILSDFRTVLPLKVLAVSLPFISVSSALSGYFTAVRRVYKNAAVQITGQFARIILCVFLLTVFMAKDVESACLAVILGGVISEVFSLFLQFILYKSEKLHDAKNKTAPYEKKKIQKKLIHISLPVAFSAYVRSGLITIQHILIPKGLEKSGSSKKSSLAAYGTVHSMVFPLIFFPSAILGSFASLLVPEIAEANAQGSKEKISKIVNTVFGTALVFALGTAGIIMCFSFELGNVIYPETDAGKYIQMVAPLIPIMYLDTAVDALLKGLGFQVFSMGVNIADALISVILVIILLPKFGITGYIITVYFTEIFNATLSITKLLTVSGIKARIFARIVKPTLAIITATSIVKYSSQLFGTPSLIPTVRLTMHIVFSALIYLIILMVTGSINIKKILRKKA